MGNYIHLSGNPLEDFWNNVVETFAPVAQQAAKMGIDEILKQSFPPALDKQIKTELAKPQNVGVDQAAILATARQHWTTALNTLAKQVQSSPSLDAFKSLQKLPTSVAKQVQQDINAAVASLPRGDTAFPGTDSSTTTLILVGGVAAAALFLYAMRPK